MATPFTEVYSRAVFRFNDTDILKFTESDREGILRRYLYSAQSDFAKICKTDLYDTDEDNEQFNVDLSDEILEILSLGMAFYWCSAKVTSSELLRNSLSIKEYTYFSPANLLRESQTLRETLRKEFRERMIEYSYSNANIASWEA